MDAAAYRQHGRKRAELTATLAARLDDDRRGARIGGASRWPPTSACSTRSRPAPRRRCASTRWSPPALSLGRFQPDDDVDRDACARLGVDVVRRPTGGKALLHGGDLTYAVALPRPPGRAGTVRAVYELARRRR